MVSKEIIFLAQKVNITPKCNVTFGILISYHPVPLLPSARPSDLLNSWDLSVSRLKTILQEHFRISAATSEPLPVRNLAEEAVTFAIWHSQL